MKKKLLAILLAIPILASCQPINEPEHSCHHLCNECQKCTDLNCTDPACASKCQGHCNERCEICGNCTNIEHEYETCKNKCTCYDEIKYLPNRINVYDKDGNLTDYSTYVYSKENYKYGLTYNRYSMVESNGVIVPELEVSHKIVKNNLGETIEEDINLLSLMHMNTKRVDTEKGYIIKTVFTEEEVTSYSEEVCTLDDNGNLIFIEYREYNGEFDEDNYFVSGTKELTYIEIDSKFYTLKEVFTYYDELRNIVEKQVYDYDYDLTNPESYTLINSQYTKESLDVPVYRGKIVYNTTITDEYKIEDVTSYVENELKEFEIYNHDVYKYSLEGEQLEGIHESYNQINKTTYTYDSNGNLIYESDVNYQYEDDTRTNLVKQMCTFLGMNIYENNRLTHEYQFYRVEESLELSYPFLEFTYDNHGNLDSIIYNYLNDETGVIEKETYKYYYSTIVDSQLLKIVDEVIF